MPAPAPTVRHPYRDRPTRFDGLRSLAGYRLKLYSISCDGRDPDPAVFDAGLRLAEVFRPGGADDDPREDRADRFGGRVPG